PRNGMCRGVPTEYLAAVPRCRAAATHSSRHTTASHERRPLNEGRGNYFDRGYNHALPSTRRRISPFEDTRALRTSYLPEAGTSRPSSVTFWPTTGDQLPDSRFPWEEG